MEKGEARVEREVRERRWRFSGRERKRRRNARRAEEGGDEERLQSLEEHQTHEDDRRDVQFGWREEVVLEVEAGRK